jgi:hypothetical protein
VNLEGYALPIKKLKGTEPVKSLDLSHKGLGVASAIVIASLICDNASVTVTDMRYNKLDTESATMLANIAKEKGISLCGITPEQTEADFTPGKTGNYMQPADAILLTADLAVRASVTSVSLLANRFDDATVAMLLKLKEEKPTLTTLCGLQPDQTDANFRRWGLTPQDAKLLAPEILVHASVTKILVGGNRLRDEGTIILCDALRESTVSKVEELSLYNNDIGPDGAKAIAALCTVCASLTKIS